MTLHTPKAWIDLYWIPLGAGGSGFVRVVGKVYEAVKARVDHRKRLALYHTALRVRTSRGLFAVEMMLPSPGGDINSRGVVLVGAVASARLAGLRSFRYEIRCWRNGILLDAEPGVLGPQRLSEDPLQARRLLEWANLVPPLIWG